MRIEYLHASKYGNGATVAAEFRARMKDAVVSVHHIREVNLTELATADLYVFSSPGRLGKPIRSMRRFLKKLTLPAGSHYAILTTEAQPRPNRKTGQLPTEEELAKTQRVRPIMNEILQGKGLVKVAEDKVHVTGLKGPLEEGWQSTVEDFAQRLSVSEDASGAQQAQPPVRPLSVEDATR
jgi:hypothetical protein